jgi:hypothetical protein
VDHNPLTALPRGLPSLPRLAILSLTNTLVTCLPALPSLAGARLQAEHCPRLAAVPYLTGCQQSVLALGLQAGLARPAQLTENSLRGVWSVRVWGGGTEPPPGPRLLLPSGRAVPLPPGLRCSLAPPRLTELALRRLYPLLAGSLALALSAAPGLAIHLVAVSRARSGLALPSLGLPRHLTTLLAAGPISFCCSPTCCRPLFEEAAVEVVQRQVQRGLAWSGEVEEVEVAAPLLYCSSGCGAAARAGAHGWHREMLATATTRFRVVAD